MPAARCLACNTSHPIGHCPMKLAGVEHCGLCGIAHFGHSRTCPHLNSEAQVAMMLGSLKESTEQRALVEEATKYLRGIRGDLVRRKKVQAMKDSGTGALLTSASAPSIGTPRNLHQLSSRNLPQNLPHNAPHINYHHKTPTQDPYANPYQNSKSSAGYSSYARSEGRNHFTGE